MYKWLAFHYHSWPEALPKTQSCLVQSVCMYIYHVAVSPIYLHVSLLPNLVITDTFTGKSHLHNHFSLFLLPG